MLCEYHNSPKKTRRGLPFRCKTTVTIVHTILERFFQRHIVYDYSDQNYVYIVTRIMKTPERVTTNEFRSMNASEYMEITYTQFSSLYDSPTKEISIIKPQKIIRITDNFSKNETIRYQYSVQE